MTDTEREILLNCKITELPNLFPNRPVWELRAERARIKKALNQRDFRQRHYSSKGVPMGICKDYARMEEDAITGSARLYAAILRAGVRP